MKPQVINGIPIETTKDVDSEQAHLALEQLLDPIVNTSCPLLRNKITMLKQNDGEGWAVGELLERACNLLDAMHIESV